MLDWTPARKLLLPIALFMGKEEDGMFMLLEDFDRFGGQIYRSNWPGVLDQID